MTHLLPGLLLPLCLVAASCAALPGSRPAAAAEDAGQAAPAADQSTRQDAEAPEPKIIALSFRTDLSLSPDLADALDAASQQLHLTAHVYGRPRNTAAEPIALGSEERWLGVRNQSVVLTVRFDGARSGDIAGDPRVRVGLAALPGDLGGGKTMHCAPFDQPLPITVETGAQLYCELVQP